MLRDLGVGPRAMLQRIRISKACDLLGTTSWSVKRVGCHSDNCFPLQFKKNYGCTPGGFRRRADHSI